MSAVNTEAYDLSVPAEYEMRYVWRSFPGLLGDDEYDVASVDDEIVSDTRFVIEEVVTSGELSSDNPPVDIDVARAYAESEEWGEVDDKIEFKIISDGESWCLLSPDGNRVPLSEIEIHDCIE